MNPEVKALKKRREEIDCAKCMHYNPRESLCEMRDRYMDGKTSNCSDYRPVSVVKYERRIVKIDDKTDQ